MIRKEQQIRYIDGPRRGSEQWALEDLNAIRAAVPADASREDGLQGDGGGGEAFES